MLIAFKVQKTCFESVKFEPFFQIYLVKKEKNQGEHKGAQIQTPQLE